MRTLVIAPNWIGDAVMAQPLLALLHGQQPSMQIDVLAPPHIAPVFRAMAQVHEVLEAPNAHGRLQFGERLRVARRLRPRGYTHAYVLPNSLKSALIPWLAGIPERIGHRGEFRYGLITRLHPPGGESRPPMVEFYAQLAQAPGDPLPAAVPDPELRHDPALAEQVRARFGLAADEALLALCPGAEYGPAKRWPTRHFAQLARLACAQRPGLRVAVLGSARERPLAIEIATLSGVPVLDLCGETSLDEAIALLGSAEQVVSNDSGLMHVTAALRRPQAAVFGSSDPRHTPPRSPLARVHWLQLACSPCFARECAPGHLDCLNRIAPETVLASLTSESTP